MNYALTGISKKPVCNPKSQRLITFSSGSFKKKVIDNNI